MLQNRNNELQAPVGSGDHRGEVNETLDLGCWVSNLNFAHLLAVLLWAT